MPPAYGRNHGPRLHSSWLREVNTRPRALVPSSVTIHSTLELIVPCPSPAYPRLRTPSLRSFRPRALHFALLPQREPG